MRVREMMENDGKRREREMRGKAEQKRKERVRIKLRRKDGLSFLSPLVSVSPHLLFSRVISSWI